MPALIRVANAVTGWPPARAERLSGRTAATSGLGGAGGVSRPILLALPSVNQTLPSAPVAIALIWLFGDGMLKVVTAPPVPTRAIWLAFGRLA